MTKQTVNWKLLTYTPFTSIDVTRILREHEERIRKLEEGKEEIKIENLITK